MAHAHIDEYFIPFLHLLTRNELIVFIYLLRKRNKQSKQCNPNLATIARETNLAAPRVTEAVKGLEAKNWIVWLDSGDFVINEKVTESVSSQVTNSVRKSYGKRKPELRNAEVGVTQSVSSLIRIEQTIEQTSEGERNAETAHTATEQNQAEAEPEPETRNRAALSANPKPENGLSRRPPRLLTVDEASDYLDASPVVPERVPSRAETLYREVYPTISIPEGGLRALGKLQNLNEEVFRRVLEIWESNGSRASNVGDLIDRYRNDLKRFESAASAAKPPTGIYEHPKPILPKFAH